MDVTNILIGVLVLGYPAAAFVARHWIKSKIEKSVQLKFDKELESFRADLRAKEAQIAALRDGVLSGRLHRQTLLDQRRLEALENVWAAAVDLRQYKAKAFIAGSVDAGTAIKKISEDPEAKKLFDALHPESVIPENKASGEQPFVSPLVWALLEAYHAIVGVACLQLNMIKIGYSESEQSLDWSLLRNLLLAALPDQAELINKAHHRTFHVYLDPIEHRLLNEIRNMLEGKELDEASIQQSQQILAAAEKLMTESASQQMAGVTKL